jgi:hypothetical protein
MSSFSSLLHGQRGQGQPKMQFSMERRGNDRRAQYRKIVVNLSTVSSTGNYLKYTGVKELHT